MDKKLTIILKAIRPDIEAVQENLSRVLAKWPEGDDRRVFFFTLEGALLDALDKIDDL